MDTTQRFSDRVDQYSRYRPHYPVSIIGYLHGELQCDAAALVADVGAGTGISSELFLRSGHPVIVIEPNAAMRAEAMNYLKGYPAATFIDGTAEDTTLADASVDIIVAAQAFHWFQPAAVRTEFAKKLKPGGLVILIWNERNVTTAFEVAYDELIVRFANDYTSVKHRNISDADIGKFYRPDAMQLVNFDNKQLLDLPALIGRLTSSSYMPLRGSNKYRPMMESLELLFQQHAVDGSVTIHYTTKVYSGTLH